MLLQLLGVWLVSSFLVTGLSGAQVGAGQPQTVTEAVARMRTLSAQLDAGNAEVASAQQEIQRLDALLNKKTAEYDELLAERQQALAELARGDYCSECKRPASQIEREDKVSFAKHLVDVKGRAVPATQELLDEKADEYDRKLAELLEEIGRLKDQRVALDLRRSRAVQKVNRAIAEHRAVAGSTDSLLNTKKASDEANLFGNQSEVGRLSSEYERLREIYEAKRAAFDAKYPGSDAAWKALTYDQLVTLKKEFDALCKLRLEAEKVGDGLTNKRNSLEQKRDDLAQQRADQARTVRQLSDDFESRVQSSHPQPPGSLPPVFLPLPNNPLGPNADPFDDGDSWDRYFDKTSLRALLGNLPNVSGLKDAYAAVQGKLGDLRKQAKDSIRDAVEDALKDMAKDALGMSDDEDDGGGGTAPTTWGGLLKDKIRGNINEWIDDKLGEYRNAALDNLWARARYGKTYADLNEDQELEVDVDRLTMTAVQIPGSPGWVDWHERVNGFFDKWIPRLLEEPK